MFDFVSGIIGGAVAAFIYISITKRTVWKWTEFCRDAELKYVKTGVYGHQGVYKLVNRRGQTFEEWMK